MLSYILKRILYIIPVCLGVTAVCFALMYLAPGNPVQAMLPADATPEDAAYLMRLYGFDQPIWVQYARWVMRAFTGDLGISLQSQRPVIDEVMGALGNTTVLAAGAVLVAFILAFIFGTIAAFNIDTRTDEVLSTAAITGVSIPNYWLGIVLVIIFAVQLGWLPAAGMGSKGSASFSLLDWDQLRYAILPVLTMSVLPLGIIMRSVRASVAEALGQESTQLLVAKGLPPHLILAHAVKNAMPQILAVMGLQFGFLVGGSILVETIFNWPGTGFLLGKAIFSRDLPLLQGTILVLSISFVIINLVVDVLQSALDPRVRRI
jgi:peptide/nickel transport system permease protein